MKIPVNILSWLVVLVFCWNDSLLHAQTPAPEQKISPGDTITVQIYEEPELKAEVVVASNGQVNLQLAGGVSVAGMTAEGAARAIEAAYRDRRYLKKPSATVSFVKAPPATAAAAAAAAGRPRKVYTVSGEVKRPATFVFPEEGTLTIFQALGHAEGALRGANLSKVIVNRGSQSITVDVKKLTKEQGTFYLQPGDAVTVRPSWY